MQLLLTIILYVVLMPDSAPVEKVERRGHNFTYSTRQAHIGCLTCHHPHRPSAEVPLWHVPAKKRLRFSLYKTRQGLPSESSLMCLTCHDGAIAEEIHLGNGKRTVSQVGRSTSVVNSLIEFPLASHPVGILYDEYHNKKLVPKASVAADGRIRLPNGRVECISCHDSHGTEGYKSLLVKSNRRSALCLSCHRL
jgi:predicted CXXCH cytochrome family protein